MYNRLALIVEDPATNLLLENVKFIPTAKYITFGNSQGKRFKYGYPVKKDVANMCIDGNDIFSIEEQLQVLASHLKPDQIILVNMSYNTLKYRDTVDESMTQQLRRFYYALPWSYASAGSVSKFIKCKFFVINRMRDVDELVKKLKKRHSWKMNKVNEDTVPHSAVLLAGMKMQSTRETGAESQLSLIRAGAKFFPDIDAKAAKALKEMEKIADDHHLRLIFFATPTFVDARKKFGLAKADSIQSYVANLLKDDHIEYYDHFNDSEFVNRIDYYKDGVHLSRDGANAFTSKLINEIQAHPAENYRGQ